MNQYLVRFHPYIERFFLVCLTIAMVANVIHLSIPGLLSISLTGLAVSFYLKAFIPIEIERTEGELLGFGDLLGLTIAPKILGIGASIAIIGILFKTLELPGADAMLGIGGMTLVVISIILVILKVTGVKHIDKVLHLLIYSIPIAIIGFYLLYN